MKKQICQNCNGTEFLVSMDFCGRLELACADCDTTLVLVSQSFAEMRKERGSNVITMLLRRLRHYQQKEARERRMLDEVMRAHAENKSGIKQKDGGLYA